MWRLESPEQVSRGTCVGVVGLEHSWWGVIALRFCWPAVVAVGGSQVVISWCTRLTRVVGFVSS